MPTSNTSKRYTLRHRELTPDERRKAWEENCESARLERDYWQKELEDAESAPMPTHTTETVEVFPGDPEYVGASFELSYERNMPDCEDVKWNINGQAAPKQS